VKSILAKKITNLSQYRETASARVDRSINPMRERYIRDQARNLLVRAWKNERARRIIEVADILPIEPRWVAAHLFTEWRFEEPTEIGTFSGRQVVGVLDRVAKKIEVAVNFPHQIRRFTGAHEIGHLVLHPTLQLLRESPLMDGSLASRVVTAVELEANIFAAELLMPAKIVRESFERRFGALIDGASMDDDGAFYYTNGAFLASELQKKSVVELAKIVAAAAPFTTSDSRTLCEIFDVSEIAMAIQLVDLGLVINGIRMGHRL
jgi:Zn-dependent peptidase ImmA (M78 family)